MTTGWIYIPLSRIRLIMVRKLFKKIFKGRAKKPVAEPVQATPARPQEPDYMRFIRTQLSYQTKYFPRLTKIHNEFIRKPSFHRKGKVPVITGSARIDAKLVRNMRKMMVLEREINSVRNTATRIKNLEHAKSLVDKARSLESQFNDLKQDNFNLYLDFFGPGQ